MAPTAATGTASPRSPSSSPLRQPSSARHWVGRRAPSNPGFLSDIAQALPLDHLIEALSGGLVADTSSISRHLTALWLIGRLGARRRRARGPRLLLGGAA